ncbi:Zinc transporter 8 like, partial [Actinidia chinensis var. chinensis]
LAKKCLESVFSSVSDDFALESLKDSIEFFSISEISDDHQLVESAESFLASLSPMLSPSSETVASSNLTPLSSTITSDRNQTEMVVNHLKQAQIQVMNSASTNLRSKKLLDALINVVIEEFNVSPEEKDHFTEIVTMKTLVVLLSFLLGILVAVMFLFRSGVQSSFTEPPPT